ncbi:hypothetical protein GF345_05135 [Candidatus Woesearchaeota archaeon]|nr:hypothetical protein [Candidatus Woesearchaeota archaeon]
MEKTFEFLHEPTVQPMPVIGLMSGSGTNLRKILEHERKMKELQGFSGYEMIAIFTDKPSDSNAAEIAGDYGIEFLYHEDIDVFARKHGLSAKNDQSKGIDEMMRVRQLYDEKTAAIFENYRHPESGAEPVLALGGYMSKLTPAVINRFLTVNVHPADLTKKDEDGNPAYTGDHAVELAILAGESYLNSTTHVARGRPDFGEILVVSAPLKVELRDEEGKEYEMNQLDFHRPDLLKVADYNQERLKKAGDWKIFPLTLDLIASGTFAMDQDWRQTENGVIYIRQGDEFEEGPLVLE